MKRIVFQLLSLLLFSLLNIGCNPEPPDPIRVDPTPTPNGSYAMYIDVQVFNGIQGFESNPLRVEINGYRIDNLGARTGQVSRFYKIPYFSPLRVRVFDPQTGNELLSTQLSGANAPIPGTVSTLFLGGDALTPFVLPLNLSNINLTQGNGRIYLVNLSLDIRDPELQYAPAGSYASLTPGNWLAVPKSEILGDARVSESLFSLPSNFTQAFWRVTQFTGQDQGWPQVTPTIYAGDESNQSSFVPFQIKTFVLYGNARDAGGAKLAIYDSFEGVF
jgi:hypothetical protein